MGGKQARLPALPLLNLAVTQQGVDPVVPLLLTAGQRHAAGDGNALPQRTRGHIHAGDGVHIGVSLQIASHFAQRHQILHGEKAPQRQRRIQAGRGVTLAQDEPVPILPLGIFRIHAQFLEIQIGEHVRSGQTAAGMSAFGRVDALNYAHTHFAGHDLQLLFFLGCHCILLEIYHAEFSIVIPRQVYYTYPRQHLSSRPALKIYSAPSFEKAKIFRPGATKCLSQSYCI